jgi:hypothetical protein
LLKYGNENPHCLRKKDKRKWPEKKYKEARDGRIKETRIKDKVNENIA